MDSIRSWLRTPAAAVTPLGRALTVVTLLSWAVHRALGWLEFAVVAALAGGLLVLAVVLVWLPQPARAGLRLRPARVTVGEPAGVEVSLRAPAALPLLAPRLGLAVADRRLDADFGLVPPAGTRSQELAVPPMPRGVHPVGPLVHERTDPLGLVRRRTVRAEAEDLYVRPRLTRLPALDPGLISDLDGVPSRHAAASDLAFHTLREYTPGDDLRHVHWRSSAKADTLLVRQYVETRRSRATVLLDHDAAAYAGTEEFEVAVSAVASLAVRALRDDFEVDLVCGEVHVASRSAEVVLDACCRLAVDADPVGGLQGSAERAALTGAASSLVVVVSGSLRDPAALRLAGAAFPADALRLLVAVDLTAASAVATTPGFRPVVLGRLDDLAALLTGTGVAP